MEAWRMKSARLFILAFFSLCALPVFSKPIEFPVSGLFTREPEPIPTVIDWDESQFGKEPTTTYNHSIARIACLLSEVSYLNVRPAFSDARSQTLLLMGIDRDDIEYHYNLDYNDPMWGYDQCAFTLAKKEINSAKGKKTLVFVIIRGTPAEASEWISNFDIGNSTENGDILHRGFLKTSLQIETALLSYLIAHKIQLSEAYFLITGHSRGGAVSNMLAANLVNNAHFRAENLYVYTFAAPNVTTDENAQNERYNFIWNIINAEDVVPSVPLSRDRWKYHKYGHVLTLANAWNTDAKNYYENLYPRMNKYYVDFLKRNYAPFKIGPFIPIQITRFLTVLYSSVSKYYGKLLGLNKIINFLMWKIFPSDEVQPQDTAASGIFIPEKPQPISDIPRKTIIESTNSSKSLSESLIDWINNSTDGLVYYTMDAFLDMHANESYLAWMLAGDEHEIFSDLGSTQLLINGSFECAVFDKDGQLVARVKDSRIIYHTIRAPIAAVQIYGHLLSIGFPANADFTVVLYRGSIAPSPVSLQIEQYSASGQLLKTSKKQRIGPHKCIAYKVKAGTILLDAAAAEIEKIKGAEKRRLVREGKIGYAWNFSLLPELNINTDASFGAGFHVGTQMLYASALLNLNPNKINRSLTLSTGLGTQQNIIGPLMMNLDGWCRFIWDFDENSTYYVPALRLTLSVKPRHRWQIFAGPVFDFHIDGFNDGAFDSSITPKKMGAIHFGDSVEAIPSIQFGIRF